MNLGYETENLEFKKSTGELKEGIISLSSMLNKSGYGVLYFGVKNDGTVIGHEIGAMTLKNISQAIANFIKPQVIPTIIVEFKEDYNIIKVEVRGNDTPYSAYGKYYIRSSDEDREIMPNKLKELMSSDENDSIIKIESNDQFLSFNQLRNLYFVNGLTLNDNTYLKNLHLIKNDGNFNLMADILSDSNAYSIKVAKFKGIDKTELIKRNEYGYKCMLLGMQQVLDYIEAINDTFVTIDGAQRKEEKLFDFQCFREAWINACLHNKWSRLTPPAVYIYSDRIEIISTGGLPSNFSEEDFFNGRSKPVNLELQKIMGQLNYIEQTGHGVPLIVNKYGKNAFEITDNFIIVTIPFSYVETNDYMLNETNLNLNIPEQLVLLELIKDNYITVTELCKIINYGQTTINKAIKVLKDKQYIKRIGSNKSGYWQILKNVRI